MASLMLRVDRAAAGEIVTAIDEFLHDDADLCGLQLYYLLERATPLREFHTFLRLGPQNRTRSGLQQSYGDHNRLLLLGLDQLLAGDLEWYRSRLEDPTAVDDDELLTCFKAVAAVGLDRPALVALWLGAALHDCGMLAGRDSGVDVEDGVALAGDILDELCPRDMRPLAWFAIRNHDYIKDVFRGEVPAAFIARQLAALPAALRRAALPALGMIQVAGAASLGEGRLSPFRVQIFQRCFDGSALDDASVVTRLARLLAAGDETVDGPVTDDASAAISTLPVDARPAFEAFLDAVPIHGWHRAWRATPGAHHEKMALLGRLCDRWEPARFDHVVLRRGIELGGGSDPGAMVLTEEILGNGAVALVVA